MLFVERCALVVVRCRSLVVAGCWSCAGCAVLVVRCVSFVVCCLVFVVCWLVSVMCVFERCCVVIAV